MDIAAWLAELGLERYAAAFSDNDIDAQILPKLTADDLVALGVSSVGHRRILLDALARLERPAPAAPKTEAERRQLTVLYCDMVGSTELSTRLDPEDMRDVIRAYHDTCTRLVARFDGYVANFIGDGLLAYFGWPRAHEDDAERAVRAGLALADMVGKLKTPSGAPLAVRVGIATGQVVVGDLIHEGPAQESSAVGETLNLASRLPGLAGVGQVVVAESTRRLLGGCFDDKALGMQALKGIAEPVAVFEITGERVTEGRFEARSGPVIAPIVGRHNELALLLERWKRAVSGEGQGVVLVGEAGIGKSRVARALLDAAAGDPHVRMRLQCSPYHTDSALWPVVQHLRHAAGFADDEPLDAKLDKLETLMRRADEHSRADAGWIAALVGLDGAARYGSLDADSQVQRARTLEALVGHTLTLARSKPVLILVEDSHWIDPTTLEMIAQTLDRIATARVLIVLTSRPDHQPNLGAHPQTTRLTLNRLGRADVEAIVTRLAGDRIPPWMVDTIVSRTDGVPLFVEELTKAVMETGEASVPASLHDSLMARLDRFPEVKDVAQVASCIGRDFDHWLLAAIAEQPAAELERALDKLLSAELIFRRGEPPLARYTFKHALIQDAASESMLRSRHQLVHARILDILESAPAGTSPPDVLAHHAARAKLDTKAVDYWQQAGEAALRKSAYHEAAAYFSNAIERIECRIDAQDRREREFVLQVRLGLAQAAGEGTSALSAKRAFYRAHALVAASTDPRLRVQMYVGMGMGHHTRAEFAEEARVGRELLDVAQADADDSGRLWALCAVGRSLLLMGELSQAVGPLENALAIYDPCRHGAFSELGAPEPGGVAYNFLSLVTSLQGQLSRGRDLLDRARKIEAGLTNSGPKAFLNFHCIWPAVVIRDIAIVRHHVEQFDALARAHRLRLRQSYATLFRAMLSLELGQPAEAIELYQRGLSELAAAGARVQAPFFGSGLARSLGAVGRADEARWAIQQAIVDSDKSAERWCDAELWRVRGDLFLIGERRDPLEAARSFERAISLARLRGARLWELRAATSLATLRVRQDQPQPARDLLVPIYAQFTDGFDTADLRDAKALLDQLG